VKIGFHAPLPPVRSGVADYAAALLAAFPPDTAVNAFGGRNLYHLGNNPFHREIYRRAMARPGVVVLHDAVMHHFFLGALTHEEYLAEFEYCYGRWHRGASQDLWAGRGRSASDARYFRWPMLRRIAERAEAVIVHTAAARDAVLCEAPGANVAIIPHLPLPVPPVDPVEVERWRHARGIRPSHTLFGVLGYLRESKRVMNVLRAFHRVAENQPGVHLLVGGEAGSSDLARAIEPLVRHPRIHREGHVPEASLQLLAAACDVGINLRYPSAGESSGMSARWSRLGRPVLVTESAEQLPAAAFPAIPSGPAELNALEGFMEWFAESPTRRAVCGLLARQWAAEQPDISAIAAMYLDVLESSKLKAAAPPL